MVFTYFYQGLILIWSIQMEGWFGKLVQIKGLILVSQHNRWGSSSLQIEERNGRTQVVKEAVWWWIKNCDKQEEGFRRDRRPYVGLLFIISSNYGGRCHLW